jgi:hypothetical protein
MWCQYGANNMPSGWQKFAQQRHALAPSKINDGMPLQKIWDDRDLLSRWTIDMLIEISGRSVERAAAFWQEKDRREVLRLQRDDPVALAVRIARYPSLVKYLRKRPNAGRPKGHAPGLADAWSDVKLIRQVWHNVFGRYYRSADPTAVKIAASFHGFTVRQLVNYGKNKTQKKKHAVVTNKYYKSLDKKVRPDRHTDHEKRF